MQLRGDERGLITNWLFRLVVGFAVIAVVIFDAGSIMVNFFTLDSTADEIAQKLSLDVTDASRFRPRELELQAEELVHEAGARLLAFSVDDQGVVRVKLRRRADTLVVGRIDLIKDWGRATAEGRAGSEPN
jgi:hypothetical protein